MKTRETQRISERERMREKERETEREREIDRDGERIERREREEIERKTCAHVCEAFRSKAGTKQNIQITCRIVHSRKCCPVACGSRQFRAASQIMLSALSNLGQ